MTAPYSDPDPTPIRGTSNPTSRFPGPPSLAERAIGAADRLLGTRLDVTARVTQTRLDLDGTTHVTLEAPMVELELPGLRAEDVTLTFDVPLAADHELAARLRTGTYASIRLRARASDASRATT